MNKANNQEQQICKPFLGQLIEKGREYVEKVIRERQDPKFDVTKQFIGGMGYGTVQPIKTSNSIQLNQYLLQDCPALEKFMKCMTKHVHFKSIETSGFFCWHGSADAAIRSICQTGFDPHRRTGQAYGRGEYFATDPQTSMGYSKGNNHLILTYILNSAKFTYRQGNIIVVDNPLDWNSSWCLPLLVITFGNGTPVNFLEKAMN